jgi:hypothetical protein
MSIAPMAIDLQPADSCAGGNHVFDRLVGTADLIHVNDRSCQKNRVSLIRVHSGTQLNSGSHRSAQR